MKSKNKEIIIPILNTTYKVVVCWGDKKFIDKIGTDWHYPKGDINIKLLEGKLGFTCNRSNCHPIIVLPEAPKTPTQIGALAHEATHAILHIFDKINEKNINEIFASSVEAIVREALIFKNFR